MIDIGKITRRITRKPTVAEPKEPAGPELCKHRARKWVHAYATFGAAYAFVPIPVPGSTTAGLVAIETTMVHAIGRIYGAQLDVKDAAAIVTGLEVSGGALRTVARELAGLVPVVGWAVRGAVAATAIEAIGNAVIAIFERRFPGRVCADLPDAPRPPPLGKEDA